MRDRELEAHVRKLVVGAGLNTWTPQALALVSNACGWLSSIPRDGAARGGRLTSMGGREAGGKWEVRRSGAREGDEEQEWAEVFVRVAEGVAAVAANADCVFGGCSVLRCVAG